MIKQYNIKEQLIPAQTRSGRNNDSNRQISGGISVISGEGGAGGGVTNHSQLSGVVSIADVYADTARDIHLTAVEANRLKDLSIDGFDDRFLRKDIDDIASGNIFFEKSIQSIEFSENIGWKVDGNGNAIYDSIGLRDAIKSSIFLPGMDGSGWQITATGAAILEAARIRDSLYVGGVVGSESFASGFDGWGTEVNIPDSSITADFFTARKSAKFYELVYSQIYGLGGSQIVSDLNKILTVSDEGTFFRCFIDTMDGTMRMNLRKDDIVRMQRSSGINVRYFFGEILSVTTDYFDIRIIDGSDIPEAGDVVFRFGNKTDLARQGAIYLTSSDDKAPYIDVLDGVTDSSMFEKVKVRIGNLSGIRTKHGRQLTKHGIYGVNAVFVDSDIYLEDGTTVEQQFTIMDGKLESEIQSIRNDMSMEMGNILRNSTFSVNTHYWHSVDDISLINVGGNLLWFNASFYADKRSVADIYRDGNRNVLRVLNAKIVQNEQDYNVEGEAAEGTYSYSFFYKVLRPGTLKVGIAGTDLYEELALNSTTPGYGKFSKTAEWDATGDFEISFTGEVLIYGVSLFEDSLAGSLIRMQTQILQNNEQIALRATKQYVDDETGRIESEWASELSITATQIEASVKSWTNSRLTDYSTILQTSNQIQAAVNNLNLSQYATTTWTSNQITNAVSGKTTWGEVKSKLTQTSESFTIALAHISDDVKGITEAFYKFDASRMYANRRIELGSGSQSDFVASAGIAPAGSDNIAFWAGGTWSQAVARECAILFSHTGSGYLAKKNIEWTDEGDLTVKGRFESADQYGNKIILDSGNNSLRMQSMSGAVFGELFYTAPSSANPTYADLYSRLTLKWNYYGSSGDYSTLYEAQYRPEGIIFKDSGGIQYNFGPSGMRFKNLPTSSAGLSSGSLYRDGVNIKIVI